MTEILLSLVGGGVLGSLINIIITRKQRRRDGIKSYSDTIDMLLESNAKLIHEQVSLRAQIASLRAQLERCTLNQ